MIPLRLELHNFMSYRGTSEIDLSAIRLACLSGENGAGKSALLDAITWALWGESRAQRQRDIVTLNETDVAVTYEFQLDGDVYRVFRRRSGSRFSSTLEFQRRSASGDEWSSMSGDNISDTQQRINTTLKMGYTLFTNSAYLIQGQADNFTQKPPGDRKRILAEILDLDLYDSLRQITREQWREMENKEHSLQEQIASIDEQLLARDEIGTALAETEKIIAATDEERRLLREALARDQQLLNKLETIERQRNSAVIRRNQQSEALAAKQRQQDADTRKLQELQAVIDREKEVTANFERYRSLRTQLEHHANILVKRQPLEKQRTELQHKIERETDRLKHEIASLDTEIKRLDDGEKELAELKTRLEALESEQTSSPPASEQLTQLRRDQETAASEIARLNEVNAGLRTKMDEIKGHLDEIKRGEGQCPLCLRPFTDGSHQHVIETWHADGKRHGDQFRENRKTIALLEEKRASSRQNETKLEQLLRAQQQRQAAIDGIKQQIAARTSSLPNRDDLVAQRASKSDDVKTKRLWAGEIKQIAMLETELKSLPYDQATVAKLNAELGTLSRAEDEFNQLKEARISSNHLKSTVESRKSEITELEVAIKEIDGEIRELATQLEDADTIRASVAQGTQRLEHINRKIDTLNQQHGSYQSRLRHLDDLENQKRAIRKQLQEIATDRSIYQGLDEAFGRNGIQAIIIENVLPDLADMANDLLRRMSTGHLGIRFETNRDAISREGVIETLDIIIRDEAGERPYQLYSGGEAFRINFAIRVALSKLLARRAGATIDLLVIDEGFGTQDSRGRDGLIEAIRSVEDDFTTILTVTHIDEIRDQFPQRIDVIKTPDGSRATVA